MKRKIFSILAIGVALTLSGCGSEAPQIEPSYEMAESASPPPPAPMARMSSDADAMMKESFGPGESFEDLPNQSGLYLAYTYHRSIAVPGEGLKPLLEAHANACMSAGPQNCLVTSSGLNGLETEYANGSLNIRATPIWTNDFLDGLASNLEPLNASVSHASTSAVDLTTQLIDTDAQLKAQTTLRDRLQNLLETRDGDLNELLGVERELARVQSQIDRYESTLANLKQRVSMSTISLHYSAKTSAVSRSVWQPLMSAFGDFFGHIAVAMAFVVSLLAYLLILIPVLAGLIWLGFKVFRLIRSKNSKSDTQDAPST